MEWSDLERPTPLWFKKAKLGIFVHWGAYSVAGWAEPTAELGTVDDAREWYTHNPYAEWYYNTIRIPSSPASLHHIEVWNGCSYDDLLDKWNADSFSAPDVIKQFRDAGADYVVLTTKHHDGITLWDAVGTNGRNTVSRGPHRNLVAEYANASRKLGIRFGAYYSGGLDWYVRPFPPHLSHESVNETNRPNDIEYAKYVANHLDQLINLYHPDILWNDINYPDTAKNTTETYGLGRLFARYYDTCPEGLVNDRWCVPHADYVTSEYQMFLDKENQGIWENCRGIGLSFGYNQLEGPENGPHPREIMHTIVDAAVRNGRILLGVGPKADGSLPEWQSNALSDIGNWMKYAHPIISNIDKRGKSNPKLDGDGWIIVGNDGKQEYVFVAPSNPKADHAHVTVRLDFPIKKAISIPGVSITSHGSSVSVDFSKKWVGPAIIQIESQMEC